MSYKGRPAFMPCLSCLCNLVRLRPACLTFSYSTVTDFARLRGWSTLRPFSTATWYAINCRGITESNGASGANVGGTSIYASEMSFTATSPSVTIDSMRPLRAVTSSMLLKIFLYNWWCVATNITGMSSSS